MKKLKFRKSESLSKIRYINDRRKRKLEQNSYSINDMTETELAIATLQGKTRKDLERKYKKYPVLDTY